MKSRQTMKRGVVDCDIDSGDVIGLSLFLVGALLAVGAAFGFALFDLSQPTVIANPGVDAYQPPPATRLEPLPRVSDAPEATPSDASFAPARAAASADREKDQQSSHKRARTARDSAHDSTQANSQYSSHDSGRRAFGYVPQPGNYPQWGQWGGGQWGTYRQGPSWGFAPPPRSRNSGGPRSPF